MGYYERPGTEITDFTPDDTETELYIMSDGWCSQMTEIIERAKEKWPDATIENLSISAEYIHTHCIYYDQYDPTDYTHYLKITYTK